MNRKQAELLQILYDIATKKTPTSEDEAIFSQLFTDWFESLRRANLAPDIAPTPDTEPPETHTNISSSLPFYKYATLIKQTGPASRLGDFSSAVHDYTERRVQIMAAQSVPELTASIIQFVSEFGAASEAMQMVYRQCLPTLLQSARAELLCRFEAAPLSALFVCDGLLDTAQTGDVIKDCFAFIELSLDLMSAGRRESRRHLYLDNDAADAGRFADLIACRDKETLADIVPQLIEMLQIHFAGHEGVDADHEDYRMLCRLRIEHAMTVRQFSFKGRPKHFNYADAAQSMRDCKTVFDAAKVDLFLMSGTLLGAVREKGFIASDYDIDIGIFDSQANIKDITRIIKASDLFVIDEIVDDAIVKIKHVTGIVIDVFLYFEVDGLLCHRGAVHEWYNGPFGLTEIEFLGGRYLIPDNHEEWLVENYGNWQKPVLFYDMSYDTPNRDYSSKNTVGIYYLWDRLEKSVGNGWTSLLTMATHAMAQEFDLDFSRFLPVRRRRADRVEPLIQTGKAEQIDTVFVARFDALTPQLAAAINQMSDQERRPLMVVLSDQHPDGKSDIASPYRLTLANAMKGGYGVHLVHNDQELQSLIQALGDVEQIVFDKSTTSEIKKELVGKE